MGRINFVLICITLTISIKGYGQLNKTRFLKDDFCISTKAPQAFTFGDSLIVQCDTLYVINKARYLFYKRLQHATATQDDSTCQKIVIAYQQQLIENQNAYERLFSNAKRSDLLTSEMINFTQKNIEKTEKTLAYSQTSLDQSIKNLQAANDLLDKQRRLDFGQKALFGVAGIGIGILIGVLVK